MKKVLALFMLLALLMVMILPAAALAEGASTPDAPPIEFFSWDTLGTYAGCVAAVLVVTQLFKGIGFVARIPTRIFSYTIALIVLLAAAYFSGNLTWSFAGLAVLNAAVVSLAANGLYDAGIQIKQAASSK